MATHRQESRVSSLAPAVKSAVVPGWGQWSQGRHRRGAGMLSIAGLLVAAAVSAWGLGPTRLAALVVRPEVMLALVGVNLAVLAFRVWATWDAGRGVPSRLAIGLLAVILVAVAAPHAALGIYQYHAYRLVTTVFAEPTATTTTTTPPTTAPATTDATPTVTPAPSSTTTTTEPITTTTTVPEWAADGRLNVLVLGSDAGPGRTGVRTDTMIVASVDHATGDLSLFGFPRNLSGLVFPDGRRFTAYQGILNEVHAFGTDNPELFPGAFPGPAAITSMIEGLSGLSMDYFVEVDLGAFVGLVDALGGVTITVPEEIRDPTYPLEDGTFTTLYIPAGTQDMDGTTALAYVRSRYGNSDYDRMQRQRCFLSAVAAQTSVVSLVTSLPSLSTVIEESVITDIPIDALPDLVTLAGDIEATSALTVGFGPPVWHAGYVGGGYPVPDVDRIRAAVRLAITDHAAAVAEFGDPADECPP